ncbi:MAG: SDR family oxidoreductase [Acidimicrobiales bacterium]|nr:SDR family oxidoreductase [Acidimicrobiales bacterium]
MRHSDRGERRRAHFRGASAVVTGAGSGIGAALATELVARGAHVLVTDVDEQAAATVAEGLRRRGSGLNGHSGEHPTVAVERLDVTDAAAVEEIVGGYAEARDGLDFLFNNAGIGVGGPVEALGIEHWRTAVDVNLYGVVHGVAAAYPRMLERGRGHIVNTASCAGLLPSPGLVPYSVTKHGVVGLSVGLRMEAASRGVRVTAVCPGLIETPLLDKGNGVDLPGAPDIDVRAMLTAVMGKPYPASALAVDVLDGVADNRAIIVSPKKARPIWLFYRLAPELFLKLATRRGPLGPGGSLAVEAQRFTRQKRAAGSASR